MTTTTSQADALTTRPVTVVAVRNESHDTFTLDLDLENEPMTFAPGQFNMLYAFGVGESAISISSDPATSSEISHTIRSVGWVTKTLQLLQPGMQVGLRGPFGRPWPLHAAEGRHLVLAAGGIGLAPLRPAVLAALHDRDRFAGVHLLVGARTPADLLFRRDLDTWSADPRIAVHLTVDRGTRGWNGSVGLVTKLVDRGGFDPDATIVMTCGPEVMMRFVAQAFLKRGVDPAALYLSMERNMRCGVGTCGHCQLGPVFVCRDGPVFAYPDIAPLMEVREL